MTESVLYGCSAPSGDRADSDVITLTGANFDKLVKQKGGKWFVELYVAACCCAKTDGSFVL